MIDEEKGRVQNNAAQVVLLILLLSTLDNTVAPTRAAGNLEIKGQEEGYRTKHYC
jgi:hypothetical protein